MGPTRIRDVIVAAVAVAVLSYLVVSVTYRWFPPLTVWMGLSLVGVAVFEAGWGWLVRSRIRAGQVGIGGGRMHPLVVARSVVIAKASTWVGAVVGGWWVAVLVYVLLRRADLAVAAADVPGAAVAGVCALALLASGMWLQQCCTSPPDDREIPGAEPD